VPDYPAPPTRAFGVRPALASELEREESPDERSIQHQPVCIASRGAWLENLGSTLLYVHRRVGDELRVGYFAYWADERPWGENLETYTLLPALALDATYTHTLFVLPGLQRVLYGAGDIEGVTVVYRVSPGGTQSAQRAVAENRLHGKVVLRADELVMRDGRVVAMTESWSHQLGARDAARHAELPATSLTCFDAQGLRPLSPDTARAFRLGTAAAPRRARAAWIALAGR
jgi:hypothetical protein